METCPDLCKIAVIKLVSIASWTKLLNQLLTKPNSFFVGRKKVILPAI